MSAPMRHPLIAEPLLGGDCVEVTVAHTLDDLLQVVCLRALVYMGEQRCPYAEEIDGNDFAGTTHLILRCNGEPIGTLRMRWFADFVKFERVAVRHNRRGRPATLALIRAAVDLARRKGYRKIIGHAQARLAPFWARAVGAKLRPGRPRFVFSDHEYLEIELDLEPAADAIGADSDPMVLLRPEGEWDHPGVLDRSAARPPTNPHL